MLTLPTSGFFSSSASSSSPSLSFAPMDLGIPFPVWSSWEGRGRMDVWDGSM